MTEELRSTIDAAIEAARAEAGGKTLCGTDGADPGSGPTGSLPVSQWLLGVR